MTQATIAGSETESVDAIKMLSMKMAEQQNAMFGDVSECAYRGRKASSTATMITAILKKTDTFTIDKIF